MTCLKASTHTGLDNEDREMTGWNGIKRTALPFTNLPDRARWSFLPDMLCGTRNHVPV